MVVVREKGTLTVSHASVCFGLPLRDLCTACMCAHLLSCAQLFATPWTRACQARLSMGFSRQEYWSESSFPSSGGWGRGLPR